MTIINEIIKEYLTDEIIAKVDESDYYFEFDPNGYHIKSDSGNMHIYQYDQYIPYRLPKELDLKDTQEEYEYSAIMQTYEMIVSNEQAAEAAERERTLPQQIEELKAENQMLTDCILEIADMLYA